MQILEDGRLTDSHGDTVYFGGTFIVFTSNLGMVRRDPATGEIIDAIQPGSCSYPELQNIVWQRIRASTRPEFINRIGENYIVFDFISPETVRSILEVKLGAVADKIRRDRNVGIEFADAFIDSLDKLARANIANGGRGVVNVVEEHLLNPLAMTLFVHSVSAGDSLVVSGSYSGNDASLFGTLEFRRK